MKKANAILKSINGYDEYGPDPVILRKRGLQHTKNKKHKDYKSKINDPQYIDFAINKIALELSHFLTK